MSPLHSDQFVQPLSAQITLSVVSHSHGRLLERLLQDLDDNALLKGTHVIVTLNLGAAEPFDPGLYKNLAITTQSNMAPAGFGANHNQAFKHCRTPWFGILNPDLRISDKTCFNKLIDAATHLPHIALLAPRIVNSGGQAEDAIRTNLTFPSLLKRARNRAQASALSLEHTVEKGNPFYWFAGMFLVVRSDAFSHINGFDERFFLYCEDYDLSARFFNHGFGLLHVPQSHAIHDAQRDSHRSAKHLYLHISSLLKVWTSQAFWSVWVNEMKRR